MSENPEYAKYVWLVKGQKLMSGHINPCDIRRYAFSHDEAISQLKGTMKKGSNWNLYRLVKVNKRRLEK